MPHLAERVRPPTARNGMADFGHATHRNVKSYTAMKSTGMADIINAIGLSATTKPPPAESRGLGLSRRARRTTHPKAPLGPTSVFPRVVLDTDLHGRSLSRNCLGCRRQPSLPGGHGKARPSYHPSCTTSRFPVPSGQRRCSALRWPKQLREKLRTRIEKPCNPCSSVSQIRFRMHFPTTPRRIGRAFKGRTAPGRGFRGTK